jgi:hypothetical protein
MWMSRLWGSLKEQKSEDSAMRLSPSSQHSPGRNLRYLLSESATHVTAPLNILSALPTLYNLRGDLPLNEKKGQF